MKSDKERDIALKSARKREVDLALRIFSEELLLGRRNDADDLDGFFPGIAAEIAAHADAVGFVFRFRCVITRVLDTLAERVALGPKFFCENFVDDRDPRTAGLGGLSLRENPAAYDGQSNGRKVISADAVPRRAERQAFRGRGRLGVGHRLKTSSLNVAAQRNHSERLRRRNAGVFDAR